LTSTKLQCCDVRNMWSPVTSSSHATQHYNSMPVNSIYFGILIS